MDIPAVQALLLTRLGDPAAAGAGAGAACPGGTRGLRTDRAGKLMLALHAQGSQRLAEELENQDDVANRIECTIRIRGAKGIDRLETVKPSMASCRQGGCRALPGCWPWPTSSTPWCGSGQVSNYAALARLGHVSRARICQITNLLHLAPDIQEQILFLPLTVRGRDPIRLAPTPALAKVLDWSRQRVMAGFAAQDL